MKNTALYFKLLLISCSLLLTAKCAANTIAEYKAAETQPVPKSIAVWPDRDWLLECVIKGVQESLKTYDPQTGEFGTKPWICNDQQVMFPLAVAWATPGKNNPYYQSPEILKAIAKAGEKLVDEQDDKGRWIYRKKDNSTWGYTHMAWTYTRWIRTFHLVKDALPPASRAKWEKGLLLGYKYIAEFCSGTNTHNIAIYLAAGLYVAGIVFGKEEWKTIAAKLMRLLVSRQSQDGFWTEHNGPVVVYNYVYLDGLGIYYHYAKDPVVKEALVRGAQFHNILRWPNGTIASVVDERSGYSRSRRMGNVGFTFTPEGRRYLEQQLGPFYRKKAPINMDVAATFLLEGDSGELAPIPGKTSKYLSNDGNFLVARSAPYQWVLSGYSCKPVKNRWFMDRQTHVEFCHDKLGVIGPGGNTKMQPYFSTFTFGDPDSFQPDHTTTAPHFFPKTKLLYVPDDAKITGNSVSLTYGKNQCQVTVIPGKDTLALEYRLNNTPDAPAMAHFPVILAEAVTGANGQTLADGNVYTGKSLGGKLRFARGLVITLPETAQVRPGIQGFSPYEKYGRSNSSRLVISLPLSEKTPVQKLIFSGKSKNVELLNARCYAASGLQLEYKGGAGVSLPEQDAIFFRATSPGAEMKAILTLPKPFKGELLADMLRSPDCGTVQILVNGKETGTPINTYAQSVAEVPPVSVGNVTLPAGRNTVTFRIIGKDPASANSFCGLRNIYLKDPQTLWSGNMLQVSCAPLRGAVCKAAIQDDTLIVSGKGGKTSSYLTAKIDVPPFVCKNKVLKLDFASPAVGRRDNIYIKGLTTDGDVVFSGLHYFGKAGRVEKSIELPLPGCGNGFMHLAKQITAPADAPITQLVFFYAVTDAHAEREFSLKNIRLTTIDQ